MLINSIFPKVFGDVAQDGYVDLQEAYQFMFEDQAKYNAIMHALAEILYRKMRREQ